MARKIAKGYSLDQEGVATGSFTFGKGALAQSLFGANGVTTDAQWSTLMASVFSAANWPGVNATSLAFIRGFFQTLVNVGLASGPGSSK